MKILIFNSLDARYGSTYRVRAFYGVLKKHFDCTYVETSYPLLVKLAESLAATFSNYDLLITQKFNPITLPLIFMAKLREKKVIVDWDDWDVGFQSNVIKKIISWLCEKIGPRLTDVLTTHNDIIFDHAQTLKPTLLLNQGFDAEVFDAKKYSRPDAKKIWAIPESHTVIGHLCTFTHGGSLDIDLILKAWSLVTAENITFLLIGGGPLEKEIVRKIHHFGVQSRLIMTGLISHDMVPKALSTLDAGVVFMSDTSSNAARISFKVIEYLSMEVPVLGRLTGETAKKFGDFITRANSPEELAKLIDRKIFSRPSANMKPYAWDETLSPLVQLIQKDTNLCP